MNIVGICRVKNNQDIVEPFIRHHLKFLDKFLICDNGSVDGTKRILKAMAEEDSRIVLSSDDGFGDRQVLHYTRLLRATEPYNPDFVVMLDSDEFVDTPNRHIFEDALRLIPYGGLGFMPWRTYVLTPDTLEACAEDSPKGFEWRRKTEDTPHGLAKDEPISKVILRTEGQDLADYALWIGNHGTSSFSGRKFPVAEIGIPLLHFPIRSRDHVIAKTIIHWAAFMVYEKHVRHSGVAWQNMRNFDRLVSAGGEVSDFDLLEMSLLYAQNKRPEIVHDPHGITYERKYSTGRHMPAVALIAKTWEQSLSVAIGGWPMELQWTGGASGLPEGHEFRNMHCANPGCGHFMRGEAALRWFNNHAARFWHERCAPSYLMDALRRLQKETM